LILWSRIITINQHPETPDLWVDSLLVLSTSFTMPSTSNIMIERQAAPTAPLDYSSHAPFILAINGFLVGLSLLIFGARIYVRSMMLKTVGADDYVMVAAMVKKKKIASNSLTENVLC
jgi:hypothetical protein